MNTVSPITLSEQQLAPVAWVRKKRGSLNLVARAGTGKTFTIINGIIRTIYDEQPRASVAVMAYNKSAGDELGQKLTQAGMTNWKQVQSGTVHSFGFKFFRRIAPKVRVDGKKVLHIIDGIIGAHPEGADNHPLSHIGKAVAKCVSLAKQNAFGFLHQIDDLGAWYDMTENFDMDEDMSDGYEIRDLIEWSIKVYRASVAQDFEVIDFDDMVIAPLIHKASIWAYDYVIMDEAQDTNPARRALAFAMLKPKYGRFVAVGDDRQAIYAFTGANSDSLDIIAREMNSETLKLTETRRCPKAVVALAKKLVPDYLALDDAPDGIVRTIDYARPDDTKQNVKYWYEGEDLKAGDAILCRNTKPLIEEAYSLIKAGIGCVVEGRDIGAGLIALATRWARVKTLTALTIKLADYLDRERTKLMAKGKEDKVAAVEDRVGCLSVIIDSVRSKGGTDIDDVVRAINQLFGDTSEGDVKTVILCTIHRSKGREWKRVFHLGRVKYLPSLYARKPEQLRQEENLEYVAFTRTMEEYVDIKLAA